jgi:branched-subunit amino acid transport protein
LTHVVNGPVQLGFLVLCVGALIADAVLTRRFHQFPGWTRTAHIAAIIAGLVALAPFLGVVLVIAVVAATVQVMRLLMCAGDRTTESLTRFLS